MVARIPTSSLAIALMAVAVSAAPVTLRVTGDRVNLRARPVFDAEVVGQVSTGRELLPVDSLTGSPEWVKVRPPDEADLWIYSRLLSDGVVNAGDTLVRGGPGLQFKSVGKLPKGVKVVVRGTKGDWTRVAPVPGHCELWIHSDYVERVVPPPPPPPPPPPSPRPAVVPADRPSVAGAKPAGVRPAPPSVVAVEARPGPSAGPVTPPEGASHPPTAAVGPSLPAPAVPAVSSPVPRSTGVAVPRPPSPPRTVPPPAALDDEVAPVALPVTDALVPSEAFSPASLAEKEVPSSLVGLALDGRYHQGKPSSLKGRLCKTPSSFGGSPARYQLVENRTVVCRLTGCVGQWDELVRSDVEVRGSLWMLSGDPVPVLEVERADRLASWDK